MSQENGTNNPSHNFVWNPPLRCRIWNNPAAQIKDKPHMTPYTVGVQWRDMMVREASFSIDEPKLEELKASSKEPLSREGLLMHMISQSIEQIFASREQAQKEKAQKLILPTER